MNASFEASACKAIDGTWRRLHGGFVESGLSIEWHDFSNEKEFDWAGSFHRESLGICLNFSGRAQLGQTQAGRELGAEQVAVYATGSRSIVARRHPGRRHRFVTLELSADFLRGQFGAHPQSLKTGVRDFLENPEKARSLVALDPMPAHLLNHRLHLLEPPVPATAHDVWYSSKTIELASHFLFKPAPAQELFCQRHQRLNRERCERVLFLLERDLENPPSLDMLAAEVGCSSFYLSRLFVQQTGQSIPRYLRTKRLEKAATLLRAGKSVTDAAMIVGYSSLSAFNKAFVTRFGCCPGLYPHARNLFRKAN